ncbi:MAG: 5-formyltetrahydrofolate cyclo-ligase [Candidatus Thiodiazotropha sp. (ex Dulcina madagascariensis)]|nr:5-formyltetrahydrofolate cyclo-ligase [Candidatus Thiodiazotropha sp. (ex Dulcina madagascariensis)]MCU7926222.1 5-formyltetrahydrofolate cyclo-ligase [Candidatus Thiodiazotropha sp. (ex Dulcina madagascariensis)]
MDIQRLRRRIKTQRQQLSRQTLKLHSQRILRLAGNYKPFRHGHRVAFYHAMRGEMDPAPLLQLAIRTGKTPYLPVLRQRPARGLWFAPYPQGAKLIDNRFGIPEPCFKHRRLVMPWALDLVFVPLIAFDAQGHRLGMGGGYYDRTFAYKRQRTHLRGPKLIGLAHEFQRVPRLSAKPWDIPLDAVITESCIHNFI